ncbi:MAG: hypothetical protein Q9162_007224 [Coniocarpon cinnabarinum]
MKGLRWGIDDWLIIPAWLLHVSQCGIAIWGVVAAGNGHHKWTLGPDVLTNNGKLLILTQVPWSIGLGLTKASACMLLRRVFNVNRTFNACVWILLIVSVGWATANFLKIFLDCLPLEYNWNKKINGHCDDVMAAFLAIAIIDVIVDMGILLLPVPFLWRLQMPKPIKVAITLTFGLGYFTVALGCLRIATDLNIDLHGDISHTEAPLFFFSYLEFGVAIIVACMVVLRPILDRFLMPLFPSSNAAYRIKRARGDSSYANLDSDSTPLKNLHGQTKSKAATVQTTPMHDRKSNHFHSNRGDGINVQRDVIVEEEGTP